MPESSPPLTEAEVVQITFQHIRGLFPRTCSKCGRVFSTYREYLLNTKSIGLPISYDLDFNDWRPNESAGNLSLANCRCGSTLALSAAGMSKETLWQVLYWIKLETDRRQVKVKAVLGGLRAEVQKLGLNSES